MRLVLSEEEVAELVKKYFSEEENMEVNVNIRKDWNFVSPLGGGERYAEVTIEVEGEIELAGGKRKFSKNLTLSELENLFIHFMDKEGFKFKGLHWDVSVNDSKNTIQCNGLKINAEKQLINSKKR